MQAAAQTILARRFAIMELAGRGGMGDVHRARDLRDGSTVAIKTLSPGSTADRRRRAGLNLEAAALDGCRARGVPRLVAQGTTPGGAPFVAMFWCEGRRLSELLVEELPAARVVDIVLEILRIAGEMHAQGWIHGDINASNVLVRDAGRGQIEVSLVDLGVARRLRPGQIVDVGHEVHGTPGFMAPELLRGVPTSVASDIYAIGAVFFALIRGRSPDDGGSPMSMALRVVASRADVICDCGPGAVGAVLRRALQREPAKRFASARHMQEAILAAVLTPAASPPARRRDVAPHARPAGVARAAAM